jgi:release factor glutamine methyltransferase
VNTIRDAVAAARARLERAGIEAGEAAMDAVLLARHLLGWDLARLVGHETDTPPAGFPAAYEALIARRAAREPISVMLGRREFWGLDFEVTPDVLAPRPETEIILEAAGACWSGLRSGARLAGGTAAPRDGGTPAPLPGIGFQPVTLIDIGTGSGCLAVCLAREIPGARVVATDISSAALAVAARNARRHGVADRVSFLRTSLLDGISGPAGMIVSNPPYVPTSDLASLPPEVANWEPRGALDGGGDGLDVVRQLLADAPRVLAPGGWLIMEFGFGQEDGVREAASRSALDVVEVLADLQGIPRTLVARRPDDQPPVTNDQPLRA